MQRILIVGGGTGGTVLANRLSKKLGDEIDAGEVEVRLVNDGPNHVYKPVYLYVAFGQREPDDALRPLSDLVNSRVTLDVDRVTDVDTDAKRVTRRDGGELDYDYLVLATGATLVPEETPGLVEGGHHFYGPEGAAALRDTLADFEGGRVVLSVVGTPHMCPAAPIEFTLMVDDWFRERGMRDEVEVHYTYPIMRLHGKQSISDWAEPRFADRDIETHTFFNVEEVDPEAQTLHTVEGESLDYDLLVAIPPHRGDDLIVESGLGDDGWVEVDRNTLEAAAAEDVYAIGDTAAAPAPKAGSVAHYEAGVVAERLASSVHGHVPTATYHGKTICFMEAGMDDATYVSFDYENEPVMRDENKFVHWAKLAYNESYWLTARGLL
ncbi:NAD(P)/FAD-dependent oxidoreductase [Haloplanus aerogenes]|uniref:NAD(P)/FAD-dependent oxidoreductase n=1 Tax=Haloplanus aerogenes TaxID=660522 RepID=A0A3M0CWD7_9EURY|nr:FAD/NAD(P)-binding oxidoreductase [Haloplanus aerogenes]AZH23933.1 NAD(P)/FAD-dependent oxidoreductase [Haloplanus aerogenes]RMB13304.1 sulfide:quinone oxidoreductase [Haloplanus aerogenes]